MLADPLMHPNRWLRAHMVPPSSFLRCDPAATPDGSGILSPGSARGHADFCDFAEEVEEGLPVLDVTGGRRVCKMLKVLQSLRLMVTLPPGAEAVVCSACCV